MHQVRLDQCSYMRTHISVRLLVEIFFNFQLLSSLTSVAMPIDDLTNQASKGRHRSFCLTVTLSHTSDKWINVIIEMNPPPVGGNSTHCHPSFVISGKCRRLSGSRQESQADQQYSRNSSHGRTQRLSLKVYWRELDTNWQNNCLTAQIFQHQSRNNFARKCNGRCRSCTVSTWERRRNWAHSVLKQRYRGAQYNSSWCVCMLPWAVLDYLSDFSPLSFFFQNFALWVAIWVTVLSLGEHFKTHSSLNASRAYICFITVSKLKNEKNYLGSSHFQSFQARKLLKIFWNTFFADSIFIFKSSRRSVEMRSNHVRDSYFRKPMSRRRIDVILSNTKLLK